MPLLTDVPDTCSVDAGRKRDMRDKVNLLGAAEAHILWKTRLGHHVRGSLREPIEAMLVGQGGLCQLGTWLNSAEFNLLGSLPEFDHLRDAHQKFHQLGELIVEKLQVGHRDEAELLFKNEYNQSLRLIIQALTNINKYLQED